MHLGSLPVSAVKQSYTYIPAHPVVQLGGLAPAHPIKGYYDHYCTMYREAIAWHGCCNYIHNVDVYYCSVFNRLSQSPVDYLSVCSQEE